MQNGNRTYREQELFDLFHCVCHAQVGIRHRGKHLDEYVQLHGEMGVLGLAALSQVLLLKTPRQESLQLY